MMTIENDIGLISNKITELLTGASFDKFSYAGIFTMTFTLNKSFYGFDYCNIDIATEISIKHVNTQPVSKKFSIEDFFLIWGQIISKVEIEKDLSLIVFFDNKFSCKINSYIHDPENLFDMRWTLYQNTGKASFSVWVSDEKNIYLQSP